ncbi:MAG: type II toxin-antitoxin system PemK/MazF family toxin [Flavobacteriaceae bacterium]|nr:type II toxin-antitoxin system PemK/MazF family toxin [Flavobacteriaceae bacterium]
MKKGDIVLIPFPFTDLSGSKNRPAIILVASPLDITVAFVSTQLKWKEATDVEIQPNLKNGLKKASLIRLSKLATLDKTLALGLLGNVDNTILKEIDKNLINIFGLV